jgi:hypothetical protein
MRRNRPDYTKDDYTLATVDKKRKYCLSLGFQSWHPKVIKILIAAIIGVAVGMVLFGIFSQAYAKDTELLNEGSHAIGTVVKKSSTPGDSMGGSDTYNVGYTFSSPNGELFNGGGSITSQLWHQLNIGSPIEVVFNPADPSRNMPLASDSAGTWIIYLAAIGFTFVAFFLVWLVLLPLVIRFVKKLIPRPK